MFIESRKIEAQPMSPEAQERELFESRLPELQQELADGVHGGEPLYFLGGLEIEIHMIQPAESYGKVFANDANMGVVRDELTQNHATFLQPSDDILTVLRNTESTIRYESLRDEAFATVDALQPTNRAEAEKKQRWLRNIDTFTKVDFVNFLLYQEFSTPTLADAAPPKGASYDSLVAASEHHEQWLEFRFGNGILQDGYYDNPGMVELRLAPCPPDELVAREKVIKERLIAIAAEHNIVCGDGNTHINVSMYQDQAGELKPVIGTQPERRDATLNVVSGLSAGIEQGAWMFDATVRDRFALGPVSAKKAYSIGQERVSIRLQDDLVELRDPRLKATTAHGLLWIMAAMSVGHQKGAAELAKNHNVAQEAYKFMAVRTSRFDKKIDLQLQRTIEEAEAASPTGLKKAFNYQRSGKLMASIFGEGAIDPAAASLIDMSLVESLTFDEVGQISFNPANFGQTYAGAESTLRELGKQIPPANLQAVMRGIDRYLSRDAVRIKQDTVITAHPELRANDPYDWSFVWHGSDVRKRALGVWGNSQHSTQLEETFEKHYVPVDMKDEAAVLHALQAYFEYAAEQRARTSPPPAPTSENSPYHNPGTGPHS